MKVVHGDCVEVMRGMEACSVDAVVCDPPYGLEFMGREWDRLGLWDKRDGSESTPGQFTGDSPNRKPHGVGYSGLNKRGVPSRYVAGAEAQQWHLAWTREAYRVLKPGGHLLAFGGTRTYHRLACAIEDAGFEIRDSIMHVGQQYVGSPFWAFGSGFPKGLTAVNQMVKLVICQSRESARVAVQSSRPIRVALPEGKGDIVAALALILPGGAPALLTETGKGVGLCALTDTLLSELETHTDLSTTLSLSDNLDELSKEASKFITETEFETIIDPKIYNWLTGLRISGTTTPASAILQNGVLWSAAIADGDSSAESASLKPTLIVTVLGSATWNPVVRFRGHNVALKPAHEPIVLARKPLDGTVAANVLKWGTGGINVDGCRISTGDNLDGGAYAKDGSDRHDGTDNWRYKRDGGAGEYEQPSGRWPPNLVFSHHPDCRQVGVKKVRGGNDPRRADGSKSGHNFHGHDNPVRHDRRPCGHTGHSSPDGTETVPDMECHPDCPVRELGEQSGELHARGNVNPTRRNSGSWFGAQGESGTTDGGDTGTAARFFPCFKYQAKASTSERNLGLDERERNDHPTVKPVDLMRWLVRLVTPPGGTVLDPFLGSGTTAMACVLEGVECVGIERDEGYIEKARKRVAWAERHVRKYGRPPIDMGTVESAAREKDEDPRQGSLFGD